MNPQGRETAVRVLVSLALTAALFSEALLSGADAAQKITEVQRKQLSEADIVFVGTIQRLGPTPRFWSGRIVARQPVVYRVDRVLKGAWPLRDAAVHHIVVARSRTAAAKNPGLSRKIFYTERRVIVSVTIKTAGNFKYILTADNERSEPISFDRKALREVEQLVTAVAGGQNASNKE